MSNIRSEVILQLGLLTSAAAMAVVITAWLSDSAATVGLVGVIVGGAISTVTSVIVAHQDRRFQLGMTALDRRFAAHQEAYALWREIFQTVHDSDEIGKVAMKAEKWWINNCLYLDAASRQAFRSCVILAPSHKDLLQGPRSPEMSDAIKKSWAVIMKPGQTLVAGVALPSLGEQEKSPEAPGPEG